MTHARRTLDRAVRGEGDGSTRVVPRPPPLLALAAAVTVLAAVGALPRWPGLAHLVALPPLDLFADLRVLVTRAPGYPSFAAGLLVSIAVRSTVLAAVLGGLDRARLAFAARFYLVALPFAWVAAQLEFVAFAALYSRVFWPGVILTCAVAVVLAGAVWTAAPTLRAAVGRSARAGLRVWPLLAYLALLALLGAVAATLGPVGAVAAVPVSAGTTLAVASWLSRPPAGRPLVRLALAVAAVAAVTAVAVVSRGQPPPPAAPERPGSLLVMSGINSASGEGAIFETNPAALGYRCENTFYYSYAGPGDGQPRGDAACPITTGAPYSEDDTQRPFDEQVAIFSQQVAELDPPVVVIGHSQGAWVAWAAVAAGRAAPVTQVVLLGVFPSSPVGYPPPGDRGAGRVGGDGFRAVEPAILAAGFHFEVDAPLSREVLARPDAAAAILDPPLPDDVDALAITATPDLGLMPDGWRLDGVRNACPIREAHPYLPLTPAFYAEVTRFLDGEPAPECPLWRPWVGPLAHPFGPPPAGV